MTIPPCTSAPLLISLLFVGACQHQSEPPSLHQPISLEMSTLLGRMDTMGQVRFPMLRPGSVLPAEMNRPMRWDWTGSLDAGVREIAKMVGYKVLSPPIDHAPVVSIHQTHATAGELINELAAAGNPELDVDVDILHHTIRINQHA
ncbi:DotD/TraH family lipoprotein [Acetobacter lambici]|uniref:DotD/TraH family lipoprotein n=2 Tax=Acetobacter lambici TaxID=1332824 RepID=UPI00169286A7|nr:DotD/TraH family lipoprotein [Acetobacter lambici]